MLEGHYDTSTGRKIWISESVEIEWVYYFKTLKSGKLGKRMHTKSNYYTPLNTCYRCGLRSTPKRIHDRDVYGWEAERNAHGRYMIEKCNYGCTMLCMACWNKVRPIINTIRESEEIRLTINKLNKERCKWQKLQPQAT